MNEPSACHDDAHGASWQPHYSMHDARWLHAMRITEISTFLVPPRWLFLRIQTDEGIVGWGEPIVEGRAHTVAAAVEGFGDYLIGQDPMRIEEHWQALTKGGFYRGGPILSSAVAGVDQALWDIAGKALDVPVHQLLGGRVRDRVRMYGWIGGDAPSEVAEQAEAQISRGLTAVKMNGSAHLRLIDTPAEVEAIVHRVAAVRSAIGANRDLAVDFHGRLTVAMSRRVLPLLEPYLPMFVEEPAVPEAADRLASIVDGTSIPIATGERLYGRSEFKAALDAGVAVVQPDLSHAGGISEVRRIAALAEIYDAAVAPHCPLGPIALAASLQVGLTVPNLLIQEQSHGIHYNDGADVLDYLVDPVPLVHRDGFIAVLEGPGLGIEVDEDAVVRAASAGHRWRTPAWKRDDGSRAEW